MPRPSAQGKLMAAAMTSFQTHGFKACTIEDIAARAGVFKGSFYNHFASKEALAIEAVKRYVAEALATLALVGPPSPLQRLKAHFETIAALQNKTHFQQGCLLANFSAEIAPENVHLRAAVNDAVAQWCQALATVIRQAQAAGEIARGAKPDLLARFIVNAWEGATIRMKVAQSHQPMEDFFALTFQQLLAAKSP